MFLLETFGNINGIANERLSIKHLYILARDSFGSSITPLLAQGYSEVVMLDLRYIMSNVLSSPAISKLIGFENADILVLYSSLVLNDAMSMK